MKIETESEKRLAVIDCGFFRHPRPRVTTVAKKTAKAAPLALCCD
jgi:hypothetical protein